MAHWAVARSHELGIARVSYAGKGWTGGQDRGEWQRKGGRGTSGGGPESSSADEVRIFIAR